MSLIKRDHKHLWHPCSQMKDYETFHPVEVVRASGTYIELANGKKIIDAISSWWCKSLGHNHPRLREALLKQVDKFEHVILANTTNETIVNLSEKLASFTSALEKVFYASDGSCAVEIAMKMSLHSRRIKGEHKKQKFMALENGYHGETFMALAASDVGLYKSAYEAILPPVDFITHLPYVNSTKDPLWDDCSEYWPLIESQLDSHAEKLTAILFEPILQGAGGMKLYSKDFLVRLRAWADKNNVHLIADEIMTGIGRTGKALACEHANIEADFACLSKGLTSGWLPLSAVLTSDNIYDLFYNDELSNAFLHSHTYSGNVLAAAVAVECLNVMESENIYHSTNNMQNLLWNNMHDVAEKTGRIKNIRGIGGMVAADLDVEPDTRTGYQVYQEAMKLGALLRPLGNTIYWLPPLNTTEEVLRNLQAITIEAIRKVL